MGIFGIISKGIKAMVDEAKKPATFKIGELIEQYVRDFIFTEDWYDLVYKTPDYNANKNDFAEISKNPDFIFRDRYTKKDFQVEVKYRSTLVDGKIVWTNVNQLKRYQVAEKRSPVFVLLATGNDEEPLTKVYLIPLRAIKYTGIYPSFAAKYQIPIDESLPSKKLWGRLDY